MKRTIAAAAGVAILVMTLGAAGCQPGPPQSSEQLLEQGSDEILSLSAADLGAGERLRIVATTSIVADVVRNVGGELVDVATLLPLGADPHAFDPTPQDVASVADSHVVFANGAGLDVFLDHLLESAGGDVTIVSVSEGIELLELGSDPAGNHEQRSGADPHVWFDPHNVMSWADNIGATLAALDPDNAETYEDNVRSYQTALGDLDAWIEEQVAQIAPEHRVLVTDHTSLSYFADRYGFEQVGAVFPGYSTLAAPSARELAGLEEAIKDHGVKAVFVGLTVNPDLAERVAEDTGTKLVFLHTGSLSEPGGQAGDYLSFMRTNVSAIVEALR